MQAYSVQDLQAVCWASLSLTWQGQEACLGLGHLPHQQPGMVEHTAAAASSSSSCCQTELQCHLQAFAGALQPRQQPLDEAPAAVGHYCYHHARCGHAVGCALLYMSSA